MQVPKAVFEIKDLKMDISKIAGPNQILGVKLHIVPFTVQFGDSHFNLDQSFSYSQTDCSQPDQSFPAVMEKNSIPFVCEDLMVCCGFGHEK